MKSKCVLFPPSGERVKTYGRQIQPEVTKSNKIQGSTKARQPTSPHLNTRCGQRPDNIKVALVPLLLPSTHAITQSTGPNQGFSCVVPTPRTFK